MGKDFHQFPGASLVLMVHFRAGFGCAQRLP
jgi:hypothetical protein